MFFEEEQTIDDLEDEDLSDEEEEEDTQTKFAELSLTDDMSCLSVASTQVE